MATLSVIGFTVSSLALHAIQASFGERTKDPKELAIVLTYGLAGLGLLVASCSSSSNGTGSAAGATGSFPTTISAANILTLTNRFSRIAPLHSSSSSAPPSPSSLGRHQLYNLPQKLLAEFVGTFTLACAIAWFYATRSRRDHPRNWLVLSLPLGLHGFLLGLLFATLNWVYDLICLVAACHAVGASGPSVSVALVTYAAGMTASSLPLLPGGLGVVDGVLILALVRGGMPVSIATAGVLIYRLISLGLVSLVGWLLWVFVERTGKHEPAPASVAIAEADAAAG